MPCTGERQVCELCFSIAPMRAPKYAQDQLRIQRAHDEARASLFSRLLPNW